jgi:hypothetical protein
MMSQVADPKDIARQWVELVLPSFTEVIYLDHSTADAPRPPALPYAGIMIDEESPQGWQTPYVTVEDTGASSPPAKFPEHVEWVREGQLLVMLFGTGSIAAARLLQLSLARHDVVEFLMTEQVGIRQGVTVDNAPEILDTTREERASLQFAVSWVDTVSSDVDVIETVNETLTVI